MSVLSKQYGGDLDVPTYCKWYAERPGKLIDRYFCQNCPDILICVDNPPNLGKVKTFEQKCRDARYRDYKAKRGRLLQL